MLKFKNDIDLKELEKFGFYYSNNNKAYRKDYYTGLHTIYIYIFIDNQNYEHRQIVANSSSVIDCVFKDDRLLGLCEDLVKAGLVEVFEDGN